MAISLAERVRVELNKIFNSLGFKIGINIIKYTKTNILKLHPKYI